MIILNQTVSNTFFLFISHYLLQAIGEYDYSIEFNEPPPGPKEQAEALAIAAAAAEAANASGLAGIAAERDRAYLDVTETRATLRQAQVDAQKASELAEKLRAEMEELSQAKQLAERAAVEATEGLAVIEA